MRRRKGRTDKKWKDEKKKKMMKMKTREEEDEEGENRIERSLSEIFDCKQDNKLVFFLSTT